MSQSKSIKRSQSYNKQMAALPSSWWYDCELPPSNGQMLPQSWCGFCIWRYSGHDLHCKTTKEELEWHQLLCMALLNLTCLSRHLWSILLKLVHLDLNFIFALHWVGYTVSVKPKLHYKSNTFPNATTQLQSSELIRNSSIESKFTPVPRFTHMSSWAPSHCQLTHQSTWGMGHSTSAIPRSSAHVSPLQHTTLHQ